MEPTWQEIEKRIKKIKKYSYKIKNKQDAINILIELGIYDKNNKLTKNFGGK